MDKYTRAKKVDRDVIVAQRIKRLSSIQLKLERNPNMKLSQMQDLGGLSRRVRYSAPGKRTGGGL